MVVKVSEQINRQNNTAYNSKFWGDAMYNAPIYGVVPGGTDVTEKLQALIDLAISEGRKAIYFPAGEYYVTSLTNADQVDFFGDNASFIGGYAGTIRQMGDWASTAQLADIEYNAKYYGAKGDGVADDWEALQNILDTLYARGGGVLKLPIGVYRVTKPLIIKSVATEGGYSYPPIIIKGEGNRTSKILKVGEEKLYDLDAACIIINGSTLNLDDAWSAIEFNNVTVENASNGALTYGLYGYRGSRLMCQYANFVTSKEGLPLEDRDRYAAYIYSGWMWSFKDCSFVGDYGIYNVSNSTSLLLENTFCNTTKIAYFITAIYSSLINTAGDFCTGTMYYFNFANVTCLNIGSESPDCDIIIHALNSTVVIDNAYLFQSISDTGNMLRVRGSKVRINTLNCYMASGEVRGYLWNEILNGYLTIDNLRLTGSGNKFKYLQTSNLSTTSSRVRIYPDDMAVTNGLVSAMPWRNDYWDWYVETPAYPINNIHFGLVDPTTNTKGDSVSNQSGGTENGVYINADFAARLVLGWARIAQTGNALNQGMNRYIPLILSGTTANRPSWQTPGMQYFDTNLDKPIWWNGTNWVDATGTTV